MIYSANMLKTYALCPKKFKYKYVEHFSLPARFEIFEKGKKIHALASYYLRKNDISELENSLSNEERIIWQRLKTNVYFNFQVVASEYELYSKIGNYWISGRLDAVVKDEHENYYILDYKTGKIPDNPSSDLQTLVYLYTINIHLSGKYSSLKFVYIDLKNNNNVVIEYTPQDSKKIMEILEAINTEAFETTKDTRTCQNCEYKQFCK